MKDQADKIDWAKKQWRDMLIWQRKYMWHEDTLRKIPAWLGIKPGITAVDVGCGLGYLGYTYWPHFGKGGRYLGVDLEPTLVRDAAEASKEWAEGGKAFFVTGDAYRLPFPDGFADLVMCQVVLIHLEFPDRVLAEMVRITKPGGVVMCKEPDNLSATLARNYWSAPKLTLEEEVLHMKVTLIAHRGRIKLGRGDDNIATRIPVMMNSLSLVDIDARKDESVRILIPPYDSPQQEHHLSNMRRWFFDEEFYEAWYERTAEDFFAGGGSKEDYETYKKSRERLLPILRKQIDEGTYSSCTGGLSYIIKGRKPE